MSHSAVCEQLLPSLYEIGYTQEMLLDFAKDRPLQRLLLAFLAANEKPKAPEIKVLSPDDHTVLAVPFTPLTLEVSGWRNLISARNNATPARQERCHYLPDFFSPENFGDQISTKSPSIILIDNDHGKISPEKAADIANSYVPGSYAGTKTWLIFEILRKFWHHLNEINAAYVAVGARAPNHFFPVIYNSTIGKKIAFENKIPKSFKGSSYFAFCGTVM